MQNFDGLSYFLSLFSSSLNSYNYGECSVVTLHCSPPTTHTIFNRNFSSHLDIVNDKFFEAIWHQMSGFLVAAIANTGH